MKIKSLLLVLIISSIFFLSCATNELKDNPLNNRYKLDLEKILVRLYEIASFRSVFKKSVIGDTVEYSLREDIRISIDSVGKTFEIFVKYSRKCLD